MDLRSEIPSRAFINGMIIDRAQQSGSFQEIVREVFQTGCHAPPDSEYQFKNPAHVMGLMYCMLVMPKEIWLLGQNHEVFKLLDRDGITTFFNVTVRDAKYDSAPTYYLIHRLRNSVAHADSQLTPPKTMSSAIEPPRVPPLTAQRQ